MPDLSEAPLSRKGALRRAELIDATLRVIVRDGHEQVTLRNVAQEAGHSHGSVAYHFGSRVALMNAAMAYSNGFLVERSTTVCGQLTEHAADIEACARILTKFYMESLVQNVRIGTAILELNIAAAREESLRPTLYEWGLKLQALYEVPFKAMGAADPAADFQFFLHCVNGLLIAQRALPRSNFEGGVLYPTILRLLKSIAHPSA